MFLAQLNWLAILVSFVVVFIAGALWFGPKTFFPIWWKAMGRGADEAAGGSNMGLVFGASALANFLQVVALASIIYFVQLANTSFGALDGALTGFLVGVFIAAGASLSHRLFAGHGFKVWLIECSSDVLNLTLAGIILGLWK
jgi:hypothetical protein